MGAKRTICKDRRKKRKNHRRNMRKKNVVTTTMAHPNWSDLHQDLIRCFAEQIISMKDFFAFRGVNKTWRSEAIKENSNASLRLQHKVAILVLPKQITAPIRNIYSLTKGSTYQLDLPETSGKFCYSSSGWLLTRTQDCFFRLLLKSSLCGLTLLPSEMGETSLSKLSLFNPLTHAHIELPPLPPMGFGDLYKFVLSSSPSWTSNYQVLLLSLFSLSIYKPGFNDGRWIKIRAKEPIMLHDALYHKGQFYVVDCLGQVFVCEIQDPNNAQMRLVAPQLLNELQAVKYFLVESATGALLLVMFLHDPNYEITFGCRVFEVPLDNGKSWSESEVKNLGNRTLFFGANSSSFSIEALDDSICKPNCIYFLNRSHVLTSTGAIDLGIYSMEDGKIDRHLESLFDFKNKGCELTSHSWLQPSF